MDNKKQSENERGKKKSFFNSFFGRGEPDKEYIPDLKEQWSQMDAPKRAQFVLGAVIGLIIFIGALTLAYFILSRFIG